MIWLMLRGQASAPLSRSDLVRWPIATQGNESRLTSHRPQDLQQVFGIPGGALAASLDGSIVCGLAHQIESEMADHGHVFGAVTGAQA